MTDNRQMIENLYSTTDTDSDVLKDPEVAYLVVHHNQVLGAHLIPGLKVEVKDLPFSRIAAKAESLFWRHFTAGRASNRPLRRLENMMRLSTNQMRCRRFPLRQQCFLPYREPAPCVRRMRSRLRRRPFLHGSGRRLHDGRGCSLPALYKESGEQVGEGFPCSRLPLRIRDAVRAEGRG